LVFDIVYYLKNLSCLANLDKTQRWSLKLHATKFCLVQGGLGWRNSDRAILRCVDPLESRELLQELHAGSCERHFSAKTTAHKIMRARYYWPNLFATHMLILACDPCQRFEGKQRLLALSLDLIIVQAPFQQWGLDFIGQFHQNSSNGFSWILTTTNYFTGWVEAISLKTSSSAAIIRFLEGEHYHTVWDT
jgi:hypothetical protein